MILVVVRWYVRPESADVWPGLVREFSDTVRAEPGNLVCDFTRNVDNDQEWTQVECYRDAAASAEHLASPGLAAILPKMFAHLSRPPEAVAVDAPGVTGFSPLDGSPPARPAPATPFPG